MKKRPMVLIFAGILSGMAVVWNIMSMTTAFYLLFGMCILIVLIAKEKRYSLMIIGLIAGIACSVFSKVSINLDLSQINENKSQYTTGKVFEVSKTKKGKQAILLQQENLEGKILLYTSSKQRINPGDILSFEGILKVWEDATNPGQFSSKNYYFSRGIYYYAYSKVLKIKMHKRSYINEMIIGCRSYVKKQLKIQYKDQVRSFLNGMILGDKKDLSAEVKDDFKESGLIHLLAVSGLHISLVGRGIYRWIRKFCGNFMISSLLGILAAIFYCILTGMSVSSMRAVIMLGVYFLSEILGEHYDLLSSASFAGICLLIMRPYRIYDTGFLYSFVAIFVIGIYQMVKPKMKGRFRKIKESFLFCGFIQIGMLPIMLYFQYEAPILSFLANVIAVPLASTAFTMAFVLLCFPYTIAQRMIAWMIQAVLWISKQSYGTLSVGHIPFLWVILFYLVLFLCIEKRKMIRTQIRVSLIYAGILILVVIPMMRKKTITFLDVGQGDCIIADTREGLIVTDGGSSSEEQVGRYRILPYIKYCGYQKIKIATISHMDSDHYSGILELLEMGRIEYLGLPDIEEDQAMKKIIDTAKRQNTKIFYLSRGKKIEAEDFKLNVLHPKRNSELEKNAASLVLQGDILGHKILLTGDVEKEGEEELQNEGLEPVEILKVAHHGSKNSTDVEFLEKTNPKKAIISCGKKNRYGHPHKETIHRLKRKKVKILRTDKVGAIIFREKRDG